MLSKEFLSMRVDCKDKHLQCCEQCKLSVLELTTKGHCCKMKSHDAVLSLPKFCCMQCPKWGMHRVPRWGTHSFGIHSRKWRSSMSGDQLLLALAFTSSDQECSGEWRIIITGCWSVQCNTHIWWTVVCNQNMFCSVLDNTSCRCKTVIPNWMTSL